MTILFALALLVPQDASADRVAAIRFAAPVLRLEDVGELYDVQPGGQLVAVVRWEGDARLISAATGEVEPPPCDEPTAVAFTPGGDAAFYGTALGQVYRVALDGSGRVEGPRLVNEGQRLHHLVLSPDGTRIAWHDRESDAGGVFDWKANEVLATFSETSSPAFGNDPGPYFTFLGETRLVWHGPKVRGEDQEFGGARVFELERGEVLAHFGPYVTKRTRGWIVRGDDLIYGTRTASNDWKLVRLDLETLEESLYHDDARGGHFLDLYLSPTGRHLVEWDFESDHVRLYDLDAEAPAPLEFGPEKNGTFQGFDRPPPTGEPLLFLSAVNGEGLEVWTTAGERLLEDLPALAGRRIERVRVTDDGRYLIAAGWTSHEDRSIQHHLDVLDLAPR